MSLLPSLVRRHSSNPPIALTWRRLPVTGRLRTFTTRMSTKSVCIVGAGPSGLVAAKTLLHNAPKDTFRVSLFDSQGDIGGLWPTSRTDNGRQVHPLMVANQSKHTMHFSDQAWEEDVPQLPLAWMVGRYLRRYMDRYLTAHPDFELGLSTRVVKATPIEAGWEVLLRSADGKEETRAFDQILVASGFFGKPIIPETLQKPRSDIPVIHSSGYRDLKGLLGAGRPGGGKILVVGGQMSGVEIAGTIASHLSSAVNSPGDSSIEGIEKYSIHHVVQRPIWVFPLFTSPEPTAAAAPFLPLDFSSYNLNNRPHPLVNTQGHIAEDMAKVVHGMFQRVIGNDQSEYSDHLRPTDGERTKQPYLAVSDWYCDFVRSGLIALSSGKVESLEGGTATLSPQGEKVDDVAAVVVATGFDASPCLDFLPQDVLQKLNHSPRHIDQPVALAFHGTHHPAVPGLGFVGFYRSPYWGVMQMQARFLARYWALSRKDEASSELREKLSQDVSIQRTLDLRDDPRCSQFPMGDYAFLMQEFSEALGLPIEAPFTDGLPRLSHNGLPLNMLSPARYPDATDGEEARENSRKLREDTRNVALAGLTTPRFVARAVFRSLLGTWKLERDLVSKLPSHPTGHFSGTAKFLLRRKTPDGLQCASAEASAADPAPEDDEDLEYLYIEEGEFKTDTGFGFKATRRYVWRYNDRLDVLSVWFVKPDDDKRADYLFHEVEFSMPEDGKRDNGWSAKAGHLCIDDFYNVKYNFAFQGVNLRDWSVGYTVRGPKKDYTIHGIYKR